MTPDLFVCSLRCHTMDADRNWVRNVTHASRKLVEKGG
jgi:hypothetical protein